MARLPTLVDDFARHDNRGRPTVELVARMIREAGQIQTTKRGRGAADMTAADAASLMLGLCGAESPKGAPEAVRAFRALVISQNPDAAIVSDRDMPAALMPAATAQTFGEAIEALISSAEDIRELIDPGPYSSASSAGLAGSYWSAEEAGFQFKVVFHLPRPWAEIMVGWRDGTGARDVHRLRRVFVQEGIRMGSVEGGQPDRRLDRSVEVSLGFWTFLRIHRALERPLVPPWVQ